MLPDRRDLALKNDDAKQKLEGTHSLQKKQYKSKRLNFKQQVHVNCFLSSSAHFETSQHLQLRHLKHILRKTSTSPLKIYFLPKRKPDRLNHSYQCSGGKRVNSLFVSGNGTCFSHPTGL